MSETYDENPFAPPGPNSHEPTERERELARLRAARRWLTATKLIVIAGCALLVAIPLIDIIISNDDLLAVLQLMMIAVVLLIVVFPVLSTLVVLGRLHYDEGIRVLIALGCLLPPLAVGVNLWLCVQTDKEIKRLSEMDG